MARNKKQLFLEIENFDENLLTDRPLKFHLMENSFWDPFSRETLLHLM